MDWDIRLAYIDPVSGSILIQTILAAVAGGAAFFRKSIWELVRRRKGGNAGTTPKAPARFDAGND